MGGINSLVAANLIQDLISRKYPKGLTFWGKSDKLGCVNYEKKRLGSQKSTFRIAV
jgi:hypothetical protein